eukprot:SM000068S20645  [mRNA]  locus=s68:538536:540906:- [translate_table: standard]
MWAPLRRHLARLAGSELASQLLQRLASNIRPLLTLLIVTPALESGRLYQVVGTQHTQSGRGGATIQVELRDLQTGAKSNERLRTTENIEKVFVVERPYTFLYEDGSSAVLMDPESFEQVHLDKSLFGNAAAYITDGMQVSVQQYNGRAIGATVPTRLTVSVIETEPYFKGQAATPSYKKAVVGNGKQIEVPSFVVIGDDIVVDTITDSYVTRAKTK